MTTRDLPWLHSGSGDRAQLAGPQQGMQDTIVDSGDTTLAQLDPPSGQGGDRVGEVGIVAHQQNVAAAGCDVEWIEGTTAELLGDLDLHAEVPAGDLRRFGRPHLGAGEAGVDRATELGKRLPRRLGLALSLLRQGARRVVAVAVLGIPVSQQVDQRPDPSRR
jgi:hypothetical protein